MRRTIIRLSAGLALMASVLSAPVSARAVSAPSALSSAQAAAGPTVKAGWVSDAALKADPSLYAKLGIPQAVPSALARTTPSASGVVTPQTSSLQCDGNMCAQVFGTGLKVTRVYTSALGNVGCISPHYIVVKGTNFETGTTTRKATGTVVCPPSPDANGAYYYNFENQVPDKIPFTCASRSTMAVFWDRIVGEKFFDIHS